MPDDGRDAMPADGARGPGAGTRRAAAPAALLAVGIVLFLLLRMLLASGPLPGGLRGLLPDTASARALAGISLAVVWLAAAPALVALGIVRRPAWGAALPAWALAVFVVAVLVAAAAVGGSWPGWPGGEAAVRLAAVGTCAVLVLILAHGIVGAVGLLEWDRALGSLASLVLMGAPWVVAARMLGVDLGSAHGPAALLRREPLPGDVSLILLLLVVTMNGAALGQVLGRPTVVRLAGLIAGTIVLLGCGWVLVRLGLAPQAVAPDGLRPAAEIVLAAEGESVSPNGLFLRWCGVQLVAVGLTACGHWAAARLAAPWVGAAERYEALPAGGPPAPGAEGEGRGGRPGRLYAAIAAAGVGFLVYGSLVPLGFAPQPFESALKRFLEIPYLTLRIANRADLVANLLLFIPPAFCAMGALTRENRAGGAWIAAGLVAAGGLALSAGIEFVQTYFPPRTVSLNDLLAEWAGTLVGIAAWMMAGGAVTGWWRRLASSRRPEQVAVLILTGYVVGLVVYQLFPFDVHISLAEMLASLEGGRLVLVPFSELGRASPLVLVGKALIAVPVGYWAAVRWPRRARPVRTALVAGAVFAVGTEVLQVFIFSRYSSVTDALLGTAGAGLGGVLATRFGPEARRPLPRGRLWRVLRFGASLLGTLAVAGVLVGGKWSPLDFRWPARGVAAALRETVQVPFFYQYWNSEFQAVAQVLRDVLVPLALGLFAMSLVAGMRGGRAAAATATALVAAGAEMGQLFFPPHVSDVWTALMAAGGGVAGTFLYEPFVWVFVQPAGEPRPGEETWSST